MSRFRSASSYGHAVSELGGGDYRLHWTYDRYYQGSRLRHPQGKWRDTDRDGALRFIKRWNITSRIPKSLIETTADV